MPKAAVLKTASNRLTPGVWVGVPPLPLNICRCGGMVDTTRLERVVERRKGSSPFICTEFFEFLKMEYINIVKTNTYTFMNSKVNLIKNNESLIRDMISENRPLIEIARLLNE